ncbi:relaxase/mobilization nuclease domain-containing protein [Sphingobacterium rhinopitheci]|uniref:relaxase/mobilization nuclease domain-containing protein n=1 Tax=Sphingobacterium rhinopitheci TaxID=2781960 RepID=UPI001F522769|nr:relaxase/mobilization nuclease domain-containing protein [Sphingobacterium rhinopitheci]MCI0922416.1 relaxase/mobilization nuclease domain-containing protein [Sphingobacterium rhinopitheci]
MIVKILKKSASFKAVRYNTAKVDSNRGELLLVKNFGILQGIENLKPQDYINYLQVLSAANTRIKYPQFHVAISTKGREHSKEELSTIAEQWMQGMGYDKQPYLLIYHKDTANNHVHIVSSRVGRDGKKIADTYEKLRAYRILNQIISENEGFTLANHLQKAFSYNFSTRAQFMLLLELNGYALRIQEHVVKISKYGRMINEIALSKIDAAIAFRNIDKARIMQIRAIIQRYSTQYDKALQLKGHIYSTPFSNFLHQKLGLQVIFHAKAGKAPYGYTVIDHLSKSAFKGSEIMSLAEFISPISKTNIDEQGSKEYNQQEIFIYNNAKLEPDIDDASQLKANLILPDQADESIQYDSILSMLGVSISDDVDDEATHGRKRRGKQKTGSVKR